MHVYIEDIGKHVGEEVTIKGWLHARRSSGKIHFLIVRDGSGFIQAVMSKAVVGDDLFEQLDLLLGLSGSGHAAVVDAAQGPQPQTWEHLAIVEQLGVPRGIPVITKADLADPDDGSRSGVLPPKGALDGAGRVGAGYPAA